MEKFSFGGMTFEIPYKDKKELRQRCREFKKYKKYLEKAIQLGEKKRSLQSKIEKSEKELKELKSGFENIEKELTLLEVVKEPDWLS